MKKNKFIVLILLSLIVFTIIYSLFFGKKLLNTQTENNTQITINSNKISSLTIKALPSPPKMKDVSKASDINTICDFFNSLNLKEVENENIKGWIYLIDIKGTENYSICLLNNRLQINNKSYEINSNALNKFKDLYGNLNYKEEQLH